MSQKPACLSLIAFDVLKSENGSAAIVWCIMRYEVRTLPAALTRPSSLAPNPQSPVPSPQLSLPPEINFHHYTEGEEHDQKYNLQLYR